MYKQTFRSNADFAKRPLLAYLKRRIYWSLGKRSPFLAYLKVTQRCNLECYYCPWHAPANDYEGELNTESWKNIIEQLYAGGVRLFVIEGGEPTVRNDLQALLEHIESLGCHSILATNCTARDPWQYQATAFTTSVDGPEEVHDAARGRGTYRRVIERLKGRGSNRVFAISVLTKENVGHIESICRGLKDLVTGHLFTFLYPYKESAAVALNPADIKKAKQEILRLKRDFMIINPSKFLSRPLNQQACHDDLTISVSYTGSIKRGCFVQHIEPKNCEVCELACFHLVSAFHSFNSEAWFNLNRFILAEI